MAVSSSVIFVKVALSIFDAAWILCGFVDSQILFIVAEAVFKPNNILNGGVCRGGQFTSFWTWQTPEN